MILELIKIFVIWNATILNTSNIVLGTKMRKLDAN